MGGIAEAIAVSVGWKDTQFRSSQAHHVGISPQEDRGGAARKVGAVQSGKEGSLKTKGACCGECVAGFRAQSHCPDAHLQVMLGFSFANSRQVACCFARREASSELSSAEIGCAVDCFAGSACC
jgi:hypothetical protein